MPDSTLALLAAASTGTVRPLPLLALASSRGRAVLERQVIQEAGLEGPAVAALTLGATGAAMPAVTAGYGALSAAARLLLGQTPSDAVTSAFLEGFGLATPAAQLADRVGLPGVASTIRQHPFLSELGLGVGVAGGVTGARVASRAATERLIPSAAQLQASISQGLRTTTTIAPEAADRAAAQVARHVAEVEKLRAQASLRAAVRLPEEGGRLVEPGVEVPDMLRAPKLPAGPALNTATPEMAPVRAVESTIDWTGDLARAQAAAAAPSFVRRLVAQVNQFDPLYRLGRQIEDIRPSENPRYLLTPVKAHRETVRRAFYEGVTDPVTLERYGPSYSEVFEPLLDPTPIRGAANQNAARIRQGLTLVKAIRDVGRAGAGGTPEYLESARATMQLLGADPQLAQFAQRWGEYTQALGRYTVNAGMWTEAQWQKLANSDLLYVPYSRLREDVTAFTPEGLYPRASQLVNVGSQVRKFTGSQRAIENPARSLADYTARIISAADRYRVGASLFNVADQRPDLGLLARVGRGVPKRTVPTGALADDLADALDDIVREPANDALPVIWRNNPMGGREYATVSDPLLWQSLQGMHPVQPTVLRHVLDLVLGVPKRIFTAATTGYAPRFFGATNPIRDIRDVIARSENAVQPQDIARGYAESARGIVSPSKLYREAESGLGSSSLYEQPINPGVVQRLVAPATLGQQLRGAITQALGRPLTLVERAGVASDRGPRIAEYIAAVRRKQHLVDDGTWTPADLRLYAQAHGRKVTIDFSDRPAGNMQVLGPLTRFAADYVPFFNPSIQGPYQTGAALRRNTARYLTVSGATGLTSVISWALSHRSPEARAEIADRTASERSGFQLFPLDNNASITIRVPMAPEQALIHAVVTAGLEAFADQNPDAARMVIEGIQRALPPIASDLARGDVVMPFPVLQQIQENQRNREAFFGSPVVPERLRELPPEMQRRETTAPTFDLIAAALRRVPQFATAAPLQVENVARGLFSSVTPFIAAMSDPLATALMGAEAPPTISLPPKRSPMSPVSAVLAQNPPGRSASEERYYRMREQVVTANNAVNAAEDAGNYVEAAKWYGRADLARDFRQMDSELREYTEMRGAVVQAFGRGLLTEREARDRLDTIQRQRLQWLRVNESLLRRDFSAAERLDRSRQTRTSTQ